MSKAVVARPMDGITINTKLEFEYYDFMSDYRSP